MEQKTTVLWDGVLEELGTDLIRFVCAEDKDIDLERGLRFADAELEALHLDKGHGRAVLVDKLIKVFRRDGQEELMLVHVEELADEYLPERVFKRFTRVFDRCDVPVWVLAVVVDTVGEGGTGRLNCFSKVDAFGKENVRLEYPVCRVADYSDAELIASDNAFALVLLAAKKGLLKGRVTEGELLEEKVKVARMVLGKEGLTDRKREMILAFLNERVVLDDEGMELVTYF